MQVILDVLGNIGFNWHVALLNFINFLIILFILNKFFFQKIGKIVSHRDKEIRTGLINAEDAGRKLHQAENEKQIIIHDARVEGQAIIGAAISKAEATARDITLKAKHDGDTLRDKLNKEIDDATDKAINDVALRTPALVKSVIYQVLNDHMTVDINSAYVKDLITKEI